MSSIEAISIALLSASLLAMPTQSQEPKSTVREFVTVAGTVERTDRSSRTLTLRTSPNTTQVIDVASELELFDELKTGDRITVRLSESVIVAVRPGLKPSVAVDTTATATPREQSGQSEVLQQLKAAVTVETRRPPRARDRLQDRRQPESDPDRGRPAPARWSESRRRHRDYVHARAGHRSATCAVTAERRARLKRYSTSDSPISLW